MTKTDWLAKFDFAGYYTKHAHISGIIKDNQLVGRCPFHEDRSPSFSVSLSTPGLWKCFASCGSGNIVQFHAKLHKMRIQEAEEDLHVLSGERKTVPLEEVQEAHQKLIALPAVVDWLKRERGYTDDTIAKFQLGFDGDRIWVPIKFREHVVNVRRWNWTHDASQAKFLHYGRDYGEAKLFPDVNLEANPLYLFEGEPDTMLATQLGLNAITQTGGAGTWRDSFNEYFEGKDVVICYDADRAGTVGAMDVALRLLPLVKSVKIIHLPIKEVSPSNKDFTDWIHKNGHKLEDFMALVEQTPPFQAARHDDHKPDEKIYETTLSGSSASAFHFKKVKVKVTVAGKDLTPWYAPTKLTLSCPVNQGRKCKGCMLNKGLLNIEIPRSSQDILKVIDCTEQEQKQAIRKMAGVVECLQWKMRAEETISLEEMRAIPEITFSDELNNVYVARTLYSVTNETLKANRAYEMEGLAVPHPNSQYATIVVYNAKQTENSFDKFEMLPAMRDKLAAVFCPADIPTGLEGEEEMKATITAVQVKLQAIVRDLAANVTHIRKRDDVMMVALLTYASVLRFDFTGQRVEKGRVESLVIGDTGTGKSDTLKKLMQFLKLGEFSVGEKATYAGLVGGLSQVGDRWHLTWGLLPLNNGGFVCIDEASGIDLETMAAMSGIRSSGIAEIRMIQKEKTEAAARLVWISNPRSGRHLESYTYGVHAIRELFGNLEDIRRIDIAVTCAEGEVPEAEINTLHREKVPHTHEEEDLRNLILWAWSRKADQVKFTPGAEEAIMTAASKLGSIYSAAIPLIAPSEMRIKVAKLAVACAVLCFSTVDGETVVVEPEHVWWVCGFLDQCYSKPSMGYRIFSDSTKRNRDMGSAMKGQVTKEFKEKPKWADLWNSFMGAETFRRRDLMDQVGYDAEQGKETWAWLHHRHLIANRNGWFVKTPAFNDILRELSDEAQEALGTEVPNLGPLLDGKNSEF